jgi:pyrroline-5-carboxylate reductase
MCKHLIIGVIGAGKMGATIVNSISNAELAGQVWVAARTEEACREAQKKLQCDDIVIDYAGLLSSTDVLILAVRPSQIAGVCEALTDAGTLPPTTIITSVAAGITTAAIEKAIGSENAVVRVMPNVLCRIGQGTSVITAGARATAAEIRIVRQIFEQLGHCIELTEDQLDAATCISASGPAFVYTFIESLVTAGVKLGLSSALARELASHCVAGSARMLIESGQHPAVLRDEVTTPAGCTISGLIALEEGGLRATVIAAIISAADRLQTIR